MSVKKDIRRGILYTTLFKYLNYFLQLLVSTVLARILTPEEYGIVAIINVFVLFFLMLSAFGLGESIVQNQELSEFDLSSLFYISIILAILFSSLFFFSASFIASFYNNDEYINITRLLSLALFFHTLNTVPSHSLRKAQKFRTIGLINLSIIIFSGITTIILALNNFSYYALVVKSILDAFLEMLLSFFFIRIKLFKGISFKAFSNVFKFAVYQLLFNFLSFISRTFDILIIGKYLGAVSLGYYERSTRLFSTVTSLSQVISPVLHPVMSAYQNDKELLYKILRKVSKTITIIAMPLSFFLYFASSEVILILYGNQWGKTVPVFEYMALMVWIYLLLTTNVSFFQTLGKTNFLFIYGIIYFLLLSSAVFIGVFIYKDFITVALFILLANLIVLLFSYFILVKNLFKKNLIEFLREFSSPIIISLVIICLNILLDNFVNADTHILIKFLLRSALNVILGMFLLKILNELKPIVDFIRGRT